MNNIKKFYEKFEFPEGMEVDLLEGWRKITQRQFGGDAGRGYGELIQNLIDSYSSSVPMEERRGEITAFENSITMTDYGEGFTPERIKLIITLGGTDKSNDNSKIGQFGIGFFSIFNPVLGTEEVTVTTKCNGFTVQIVFVVKSFNELPELKMKVLDENFDFSTQIVVRFKYASSVEKCLNYAMKSLNYYPCKIQINGKIYESVWEKAKRNKWYTFSNNHCNGFISPYGFGNRIHVMCKYEHIIFLSLNGLLSGSETPAFNLEDFRNKSFPYIPEHETHVNCNDLSLTISRDSFYLNYNYTNMLNSLREEYFKYLSRFNFNSNDQIVLANLYIFSYEVGQYLKTGEIPAGYSKEKGVVIRELAEAIVFRIADKKNQYSLKALKRMLTPELPLFYSSNRTNVQWLGGAFKHDFVLLPERCHLDNGARDFYKTLLSSVFGEIIDLDTIQGNNAVIKKLVEKEIVSADALSPQVDFVGQKQVTSDENLFLEELNQILSDEEIIQVIEQNLYLNISSIKAIFFEIKSEGAYISTGIFDENLAPVSDNFISNLERKNPADQTVQQNRVEVLLGLRKDHPLIQQLISSNNKHKSYFALTYIAHELAFCQRLLVPYSSFFHFTKEKLAADMRKALMNRLFKKAA
jgi:hypothetical protein